MNKEFEKIFKESNIKTEHKELFLYFYKKGKNAGFHEAKRVYELELKVVSRQHSPL